MSVFDIQSDVVLHSFSVDPKGSKKINYKATLEFKSKAQIWSSKKLKCSVGDYESNFNLSDFQTILTHQTKRHTVSQLINKSKCSRLCTDCFKAAAAVSFQPQNLTGDTKWQRGRWKTYLQELKLNRKPRIDFPGKTRDVEGCSANKEKERRRKSLFSQMISLPSLLFIGTFLRFCLTRVLVSLPFIMASSLCLFPSPSVTLTSTTGDGPAVFGPPAFLVYNCLFPRRVCEGRARSCHVQRLQVCIWALEHENTHARGKCVCVCKCQVCMHICMQLNMFRALCTRLRAHVC